MKILSSNAGYLLGYHNVLWGYAPPPVSALLGDAAVERRQLEALAAVIEREQPDVVSLLEVDGGSHRTATDGQCRRLRESLRERDVPYEGSVASKYGADSLAGSLPFFGHLGNAALTRTDRPTTAHYLTTARKRLVLEVDLGSDLVLFVVHLPLGTSSRARQLTELADLVATHAEGRDVIVTGDFNTFGGTAELDPFLARTGLEVHAPGATVPARAFDDLLGTSRQLDLFLCSPSVEVERCEVLDVQVSDHWPIVMETAR